MRYSSLARIAEIRKTAQKTGAECVFSEPQFNVKLIDAVFSGASARTSTIDPLGASLLRGSGFYDALLKDLAMRIEACLQSRRSKLRRDIGPRSTLRNILQRVLPY